MSAFDQQHQEVGVQYNIAGDMNIHQKVAPRHYEEKVLKSALARLAKTPLDRIPKVATLPEGSRFPAIRPNPLFVGREDDLKQLAAWLKGEQSVAIGQVAAATGMGGIGKTQLAAEFAHRYGQYFAGGVFWLSFAQPELVPTEVAACGDPDDARPLEARVKSVLSGWQSEMPRLLIFDNCEELDLLKQWLPPTGGSRVLVTSRQGNWGPEVGVQHLALGVLERAESVSLLRGFREDLVADDPNLDAVAKELGDLPLALHMAGSFLRIYHHDITPGGYLEALRRPGLLDHRSLKKGEFSPTGHDRDVGRTFALSVERLGGDETDCLARGLLVRAACFASGESIPRELLKASAGEKVEFSDGVQRLLELGLVEETKVGNVWMHRLVACFVQDALWDDKALEDVEEAVSAAASEANRSGFPARMGPILVHLRVLTDRALTRGDERAARLANSLGYYLDVIADHAGARAYFEQALAICRKTLAEEHPSTATSLNNLGYLLGSMGDYVGARPYYEKALAIRRKVLGEEHPDTASSLNNLGHLLKAMGDPDGARPYYEQALAICRKVLGEEHPDTAGSLNNLGALLQAKGDDAGARAYFEQALAICRKVLGEEHPVTASSLNNMGGLLDRMGEHANARPYYEQALAIRRKVLGEEHPDTASSLNNLGYLMQAMGDPDGARAYYEQALSIRRKVLGEEHPDTANSLNNIGYLLHALGDFAGAWPYLEKALAIRRKVLGEAHPDTAISLNNMGALLDAMDDPVRARPYLEQALAVRWKALGEEHPMTISSLTDIGSLLYNMGNLLGAQQYLEQALAIRMRILGKDHLDTATSLNMMGHLMRAMGNHAGARLYYEQAMATLENILGPDHPTTRAVHDNLESLDKGVS